MPLFNRRPSHQETIFNARFASYTNYLSFLAVMMDNMDGIFGEGSSEHFLSACDAFMSKSIDSMAQDTGTPPEMMIETGLVHRTFMDAVRSHPEDTKAVSKTFMSLFDKDVLAAQAAFAKRGRG